MISKIEKQSILSSKTSKYNIIFQHMKHLFKQTFFQLKKNKVIFGLTIIGSALSVAGIMLLELMIQIYLNPTPPEVNKERTLIARAVQIRNGDFTTNSYYGIEGIRKIWRPLKTPELVGLIASESKVFSSVSKTSYKPSTVAYVDGNYFKILSFDFVEGRPFTENDCINKRPVAVITNKMAIKLWGHAENAVGKTILNDQTPFKVIGIVEPATMGNFVSSSDIWIPYTTSEIVMNTNDETQGIGGGISVLILAKNKADFPKIQNEIIAKCKEVEQSYPFTITPRTIDTAAGMMYNPEGWANHTTDPAAFYKKYGSLALLFLLVPAVNLLGLIFASFKKREAEISIRRAYGASIGDIISLLLRENLIITCIGGVIGLILAWLLIPLIIDFLIFHPDSSATISIWSLIKIEAIAIALIISFLLNFLCSSIPAWRVSKTPIVNSL